MSRFRPVVQLLFAVLLLLASGPALEAQAPAPTPVTAIRAGRLLDPETGRVLANQIILVEGTRIRDVGPSLTIPPGAHI